MRGLCMVLAILPVCLGQSRVLSFRTLTDQPSKEARKSVQLAFRAYEKKDLAACERHLDEALAESPQSVRVLSLAGAFAMERKQYDRGARLLARAVEITPTDPDLLAYLAVAKSLQLDLDAAIYYSKQCLRFDPANQRANLILGMSLATLDRDLATAARSLERASTEQPDALLFLAFIYDKWKQPDQATDACRRYLEDNKASLSTCLIALTPERE